MKFIFRYDSIEKERERKKRHYFSHQDPLIPRFTKCIKHLVISLFIRATISQRNFSCTLDHINSSSNVQLDFRRLNVLSSPPPPLLPIDFTERVFISPFFFPPPFFALLIAGKSDVIITCWLTCRSLKFGTIYLSSINHFRYIFFFSSNSDWFINCCIL